MKINLPTGLRGDSGTPKQYESLINCYLEQGQINTLSPRPGITLLFDRYAFTRGQGVFQDQITFETAIYSVEADRLYKTTIDENGVITREEIGAIDGSENCLLIPSFTHLLIQRIGAGAYSWDGETFKEIDSVNYEPCIWATFTDGHYVFTPAEGGPIFWSNGYDPNDIDAANFSDAERKPDRNYAAEVWRGNLIVFGGETIERQSYNANANAYQTGTLDNIGFVGGLVRFGNDLMFIGRPVNGTFSMYVYADGGSQRISNKAVDEVLNLYSFDELNESRADFFSWRGEDQAVWHLPNHTLHFYGDFAFIKSGVNGKVTGNWQGQFITSYQGRLIVGDRDSSNAGVLSEDFNDYGEIIEAEANTYVRGEPRSNFKVTRLTASVTTGQTNDDQRIELSITEDGVHYGESDSVQFQGIGIFNDEISWQPIGMYDNYMGIKLRWVGDIKVPIDGVYYV